MPPQFYARYIPPIISNVKNDGEPSSLTKKKKKKFKETGTKENALDHSSNFDPGSSNTGGSKSNGSSKSSKEHRISPKSASRAVKRSESEPSIQRQPKKLKTDHDGVKINEASTLDENAGTTIEDKHKSIRAKFQEVGRTNQQALGNEVENDEDNTKHKLTRIQSAGLQPLPQPKRVKDGPRKAISTLPEWLTSPVLAVETAPFSDLNMSPDTVQQLSQAGFNHAFAIQTAVLSRSFPGSKQHRGDICVSAFTGSGKTLAYTLPIIEALKDKPVTRLRALIIVPTRELVLQVQEVFRITGSSLKVGTAVGSKSLKEERDTLINMEEIYDPEAYQRMYVQSSDNSSGVASTNSPDQEDDDYQLSARNHVFQPYSKVDVLICTPGRLVDHIRDTRGFTLEHLQWLIVDEADRLLDQSFQEWIDIVMPKLEKSIKNSGSLSSRWHRLTLQNQRPLRKIILSATMTKDYGKLMALNLQNPMLITVKGTNQDILDNMELDGQDSNVVPIPVPERLSEIAVAVKDATNKPLYLVQLIQDSLQLVEETGLDTTFAAGLMKPALQRKASSSGSSSDSESMTDSSGDSYSKILSDESDREDDLPDRENPDKYPTDIPMPDAGITEPDTSSAHDGISNYGMLVFTNTNESALRLCRLLVLLKPSWASRISALTKSIGTSSGRKALRAFRKRKIDVLVATDLASRGLDLSYLAHVVNYDLPKSATTYIHRVGRTARAGRPGVATTLIAHHEAKWFWNEIGRSLAIQRSQKVKRQDMYLQLAEHEQEAYESALERLGQEARGGI